MTPASLDWFVLKSYVNTIAPVRIERFTQNSVWINRRRQARAGSWGTYYPTWEEAHAVALERARLGVIHARNSLQVAEGKYGNVKGMKPLR